MRVNVIVKRGWILERCAQELADRIPGVTINAGRHERTVDPKADAHYYLPAKDIRKYPNSGGLSLGFFTHGQETLVYADQFDACIAMNEGMGGALQQQGGNRVTVIRPGTDLPHPPPASGVPTTPVFGVVGRVYASGRKGEHLVRAAVEAGYTFVACGTDQHIRAMAKAQWPCPTTHTIENRSGFYRSINYLVVPSTLEGGPMCVPEAIAHRVPVIAPDVGWCWEFPCYRYTTGSVASLLAVLRGLTTLPTWVGWGYAHQQLFDALASTQHIQTTAGGATTETRALHVQNTISPSQSLATIRNEEKAWHPPLGLGSPPKSLQSGCTAAQKFSRF